MESTTDVPTESEYKAFQDLRSHLIMLKNGLPYFEESIHPVMEVLKVKDKILNQHNKDAYRLGSTYQSRPFELVDTAPLKKAFEADQFKLHEMKKEISKCSKELEHYRYEWQTIIKPPKEMLKDFFIVRVSPEVNEIFNKHIDYLQDRLDHLKLYENGYYLESCSLNCFLKDMNYYKEHYEKDLVEYKDKIKMYERICEPESRLIDRNKYLGMNYQNINVENIKKMTTDYENILDERISQVEAKLKEMETIKELRKDEMDMVEMKSDMKDMIMDEDRKDAILHCLADETLEYVYDRTSTGFYYVSTDNLRFTANERFDINLTDEDLSKIYDYMNLDFYVLDSECEWDEDENGEYFGIAVGSDRVNGGYEFGDYCDLDEERYELRQTLFDEMCGQNPIAYDADKECLTLPDGRVINNMLSRTLTDEEVCQAYDSFMQNDDFASLLDREIVPMVLDIIEENERRENLKIQDIIDAPLKWDSKTKPDGVFIGMTVADFVFSHGLHQNMKLNDFNELLAKEGYSTFPNKQYPFTNLERMISDEEFKLDVLNISNNLNKIYDETDFVYEKGIEESDVAEVVFDGICDDYELSRLVNKCEGKDQLKDFVAHCEDIQGLFVNAVEMEIQEMEI